METLFQEHGGAILGGIVCMAIIGIISYMVFSSDGEIYKYIMSVIDGMCGANV